ncbi:MAG TPA: glycosyltransferase [Candidatus Gemmiger faecigallinarum]|nr:glycosyltransferase [Candidatus Gemmiger faecigallinarum]
MARISVIMPVYNAAAHLPDAVRSVLGQTFADLELILVDDGSTDGSGALCDGFAAADPRVRVVHQQNAGICAARNAGLALAQGDYVGFCDDDDVFLPDFLAAAWDLARRADADLVRFDYRIFRRDAAGREQELPHTPGTAMALGRDGGGSSYGAFLRAAGPLFVWNALYRRAALDGLRFDTRCRRGVEDFVFNASFHLRMGKAVYRPQVACLHYERAASTSASFSADDLEARTAAAVLWAEAEGAALDRWCRADSRREVAAERRAEIVTFLMHQLRDARAPRAMRRQAWHTLRPALDAALPRQALDFLRVAGKNKKQMAALALYALHLQGLYQWVPNREEMQ